MTVYPDPQVVQGDGTGITTVGGWIVLAAVTVSMLAILAWLVWLDLRGPHDD